MRTQPTSSYKSERGVGVAFTQRRKKKSSLDDESGKNRID